MTDDKGIVVSEILNEMRAYQANNDSHGLIEFSQAVKRYAIEHINLQDPKEASEALEKYSLFFREYVSSDPSFTLAILPLFPTNKVCTTALLGISQEIDEAIVHYKLDRTTFSRAKFDGMRNVALWALRKGDIRFAENFITHVVNDLLENHPDKKSIHTTASGELISCIVWDCDPPVRVSKRTDQAIASLVTGSTSYRLDDRYWIKIVNSGLHETLLMMMKHGRINALGRCDLESQEAIASALPVDPTPEQANWITQSVPHPELKKQILFSPEFDLDGFILAMKERTSFTSSSGDMTFKGLSVFKDLMTPEHLDSPEKRRRVSKLLDTAADCILGETGKKNSTKDVREAFDKSGLPQTLLRIMRLFKAQQLEDELGM